MTVPYWLLKKEHHKNYDFIIIGGGISGVSTAYWLKKNYKHANVLLIEKNKICSGASGRNAGFISAGSIALFAKKVKLFGLDIALEIRKNYQENHDLISSEILTSSLIEKEVEYKKVGSITLDPSYGFYKSVLNNKGFSIDQVSEKDILNQGLDGFGLGFIDNKDASVHSYKLVRKILELSQVDVLEDCEVYKTENKTLYTNRGDIYGNHLIYCLNGYSSTLLDNKISPIRGQMMVVETDNRLVNNFYSPKHLCYFRPLDDKHVLIGGFRSLEESTEIGFSDHYVTPKIQNAFWDFLNSHLVNKNIKIKYQWAGIMGFTKDDMPLIGEVGQNVYVIGGYNGHGMGQAFFCSKVLVDNIFSGKEIPKYLDIKRKID